MRVSRLILLVMCLLAWATSVGLVFGAEPPRPKAGLIDVPATVSLYKMIDAKLVGDWEQAIWEIIPATNVDSRTAPDGKSLTFVAPAGSYTLDVVVINFATKRFNRGKQVVVIGTAPDPGPGPGPDPGPGPTPGGKYKVMLLIASEKANQLPKEQREMIAGLTFRQEVAAKGHSLLGIYDPDPDKSPPEDFKPWFAVAVGKTMPLIAITPITTTKPKAADIKAFPLPVDKAAFWKLLDKGGL